MARRRKKPDTLAVKVREALCELRLTEMAAALDEELANAPKRRRVEAPLDMLWRLVERQLRYRRERAVERRIREARFPAPKSLDGFDFAFQPKLDRGRIMELATLEFVRRGQNVLFGGMSGTGKSHLAISLGFLACAQTLRVRYTTSSKMLELLNASLATESLPLALKPYLRCDLLIIDEVGLDRVEREASPDADLFYKVIAPRCAAPKSTIITSNIGWDQWGAYFGDDVTTVAILDRLVHRGYSISIDGPSYRAEEHKKLNKRGRRKKGGD